MYIYLKLVCKCNSVIYLGTAPIFQHEPDNPSGNGSVAPHIDELHGLRRRHGNRSGQTGSREEKGTKRFGTKWGEVFFLAAKSMVPVSRGTSGYWE